MKNHKRRTTAALVLTIGAGLSFGALAAGEANTTQIAQAEATDINAAIVSYRQAQADLDAAIAAGGDSTEAQIAFETATTELHSMCQILGQDDIEACIAAVAGDSSGQPIPETTAPVPAEQPAVETEPSPVETVAQPADEPAPPPAAGEQPAEPAATESGPAVVEQSAEPQIEGVEPVAADPAAPLAPPALLLEAVSRYETSNAALADAMAQGGDTDGPLADAIAARDAIETLCSQLGQPDTNACLAQFGLELSPLVVVATGTDQMQPADQTQADTPTQPSAPDTQPADQEPAPATLEAPAAEAPPVEVNPAGTPIPRDLGRAIAAYEQANRQLGAAVVGTPEALGAQAEVQASLAGILALCEQGGQPDFNACLAAYGVALSPMAVALNEAAVPVPETAAPAEVAPVLDSDKDAGLAGTPPTTEQVEAEPPPVSDAAAQVGAVPDTIPSIEAMAGTRISGPPQHERPPEAQVVEQTGLRIVIQFNNQLIISNQSDTRLNYGATERYVEQLPLGRTRETILRQDGSSLVTVYNRNGDILHRSHFDQNGNETVFSYVPDNYDQDLLNWRDPGMDLPPLRLTIPVEEYVLDAQRTDLDDLTLFLEAPPVEQVQRLYSIDEVKRSARLRDMVRRLEIGNLTFAFGAASIPPDQIGALSIVANAMLDLIDKNPAETFLIEGHTDAVGTNYANLILSDQRAETVAVALTEVFGVPPENIATQGFGERYLKVTTEAPEELNRRVTIRRITPLVAPAAG
ncbi:MAG: OmpA family protein [Alphaproteobacteria bacterium]|nr:OmpA family protein [Alphaproteobacteria bacterium]